MFKLEMKKAVARELAKTTALYLPPTKFTTDNAAMIGAAGYLHAARKEFTELKNLYVICYYGGNYRPQLLG